MTIVERDTRTPNRRDFLAAGGLAALWPGNWFSKHVDLAGIRFRRIKAGPDGRHFLWIHGNERTAHDVLVEFMKPRTGRAFLVESTVRNVPLGGGKIDPNRMFSREGAQKSLKRLNAGWTDPQLKAALDRLDRSRNGFLSQILPRGGEVLVALHNNSEGYSMTEEIPVSDATALNDKAHPHEFMLCTQRADFQILAGGPFNVLLQNTGPKDDDGSLSRLCAKRGIRYVNIEATLGNADAQRRMLQWVDRVL